MKPEEPDGEKRKVFLNQVRQHLGILPFMGVNAVCYKAADAPAELIELENVLPEDFQKKVAANALYQPNLQLTGVYLMQEARKGKDAVDRKVLHDLDEEFSSNLVKQRYLCRCFHRRKGKRPAVKSEGVPDPISEASEW